MKNLGGGQLRVEDNSLWEFLEKEEGHLFVIFNWIFPVPHPAMIKYYPLWYEALKSPHNKIVDETTGFFAQCFPEKWIMYSNMPCPMQPFHPLHRCNFCGENNG